MGKRSSKKQLDAGASRERVNRQQLAASQLDIPWTHLSAPAQDNILLILTMWKGWTRTLKWKASLPAVLTMYLLAQIRAASRASDESCSYSSETRWQQKGKSLTLALFRPRSKIRILGSGTPRLYLDFGNLVVRMTSIKHSNLTYGLFLQYR
jgi:hypothetical protein